jgi:ribosome recycling factor
VTGPTAVVVQTKKNIRRVRQKAVDRIKKQEGVGADETFRLLQDVQKLTNDMTEQVSKLRDTKAAEIEASG